MANAIHNYGYDINHVLAKSSEKGNYQVESFALQLDDMLSNLKEMTPEVERFVHATIEFLYGLVEE